MRKRDIPAVHYPLISSQQTMYYMIKFSIHKSVMQIPTSITVNQKLDMDLLKKAVNIEIERNDCMRLRFFKLDKEIRQHFLPKVVLNDIPVKHFATKEEMQSCLEADAQKPVRWLKDEIFRIILFTTPEGHTGVYLNASHIIMDALACGVFYGDLLAVYNALSKGEELPEPLYPYEDAIKADIAYLADTARYEKDKKFYYDYWTQNGEPFYAGIHGPAFLEKMRKKTKNPDLRVPAAYDMIHDKCEIVRYHVEPVQAKKIFDFCMETKNAPENLVMLGMRTHASAINYRTPDTLMLPLCSRRVTYKTKRMGGCLAQPLQVHSIIEEDKTFREALAYMFSLRTQLYRHSNFPYMHTRVMQQKIFNFKTSQGPSFMMYTWLPLYLPLDDGIKIEFAGYNPGRYIMPLYAFSLPTQSDGGMDFYYMYRPNLISAENIDALHKNCVRVMVEGIENPDITIGELMDRIS